MKKAENVSQVLLTKPEVLHGPWSSPEPTKDSRPLLPSAVTIIAHLPLPDGRYIIYRRRVGNRGEIPKGNLAHLPAYRNVGGTLWFVWTRSSRLAVKKETGRRHSGDDARSNPACGLDCLADLLNLDGFGALGALGQLELDLRPF